MIDQTEPAPAAPAARGRRLRRRWWIVGAVLVLVVAGAITGVSISLHYAHAVSLSTDGGGWIAPDNAHVRSVSAGPYTASVIRPRPGHRQTFEMDLNNESSVSQTVLGLYDSKTLGNPKLTGEPETLKVSTSPAQASDDAVRFTSKPVTIPPGGQYALRWTEVTEPGLWKCDRTEYVEGLQLRVRVGFFTRTETVDFNDLAMEIKSAKGPC